MAFVTGMLAGLTSVAALIIGSIAFLSPNNDVGRLWGWIAACILGVTSIGLWDSSRTFWETSATIEGAPTT